MALDFFRGWPQHQKYMDQNLTVQAQETHLALQEIVPRAVAEYIDQHQFEHPEYFDKDEKALYKLLKEAGRTPTPTDNRLRLKFWTEFDRVQGNENPKMTMAHVFSGVCHKDYFYSHYIKNYSKLAWMLCQPTGYMIKAEEALEFGLEQLRDILGHDHSPDGMRIDTKLAAIKVKIVEMLDARVRGAVVQKTMNLNVSTKTIASEVQNLSMEELDKKLTELRRRDQSSRNVGTPIVEVESE